MNWDVIVKPVKHTEKRALAYCAGAEASENGEPREAPKFKSAKLVEDWLAGYDENELQKKNRHC